MNGFIRTVLTALGLGIAVPALAGDCVTWDGDRLQNGCSYKVFVKFWTTGGCYVNSPGALTINGYGSSDTSPGNQCGHGPMTNVRWTYCRYDAWVRNTCSLN